MEHVELGGLELVGVLEQRPPGVPGPACLVTRDRWAVRWGAAAAAPGDGLGLVAFEVPGPAAGLVDGLVAECDEVERVPGSGSTWETMCCGHNAGALVADGLRLSAQGPSVGTSMSSLGHRSVEFRQTQAPLRVAALCERTCTGLAHASCCVGMSLCRWSVQVR